MEHKNLLRKSQTFSAKQISEGGRNPAYMAKIIQNHTCAIMGECDNEVDLMNKS